METLREASDGIDERDIVWFVVTGETVDSNLAEMTADMAQSVRDKLTADANGASVILIGKDGGVKDRSRELDLDDIFSRIDRMPMRRREMREQGTP